MADFHAFLGVFCTVMIFHIFFTYPETAQKSLEEIDVLFDSNIPPWRSAKVNANALQQRAEKIVERGGSVGFDDSDKEKEMSGDRDEKQEVV